MKKSALIFLASITVCFTIEVFGQSARTLFVFVGEKVSVIPFEPDLPKGTLAMDNAFKAKYKILQTVFGQYAGDIIEFEAYDHYGVPAFAKFNYVLLYVSRDKDGKLCHEKYMYSDVYITRDGRWAGSYEASDYEHDLNKGTAVKPEPIDFVKPVWYNVRKLSEETIRQYYPEPYFRIKRGRPT